PSSQHTLMLAWHGEITAANAEVVWEQTRERLSDSLAFEEWVLELEDVPFIDSTGLGIMVQAQQFAKQDEKVLIFKGLKPAIRNVIRIAKLEQFLLNPGLLPRRSPMTWDKPPHRPV